MKPRPLLPGIILILLFATALPMSGFAGELDATRERLNRIQQRIEKTEKSLQQKKTEARTLRDELEAVEKERRSLVSRKQRLETQLKDIERRHVEAKKDAKKIRAQVAEQRALLEKRLASLYKTGGGGVVKLLFSGMKPSDLETQFRYMLRVLGHDRDLLSSYRDKQATLEKKLDELEQLQTRKQTALEDIRKHQTVLAQSGELKKKILAKVRKDQQLLASLKSELESKAGRLSKLIVELKKDSSSPANDRAPFARQKGSLPWPVTGKVRIGYGPQRHPDLGTLFDSNGIEISSMSQTPVKAVWGGRVAFANRFKGYGNLVIIDHGNGYHSLYAHASRIVKKVGERVNQGDVLAYSGTAGSVGVYFEIRSNGKPVDPEAWLDRRR